MGTETSTTQQVFRQRSSVGLAAMSGLTGLLLLLSLARNWAAYPQPLFAAWVILGLAVAWSVFVRPAVLLDAGGVTLRNIVRDVHIPWARLSGVTSRWNLKILVGERGYNAWAISAQVDRPTRASAGMSRVSVPGRVNGVASAGASASTTVRKATAESVAVVIKAAKQEYDESVARGQFPASPDAVVRITWVPLVMAVLLLPAVAVVALSLI
jgi:Bacterial PH domain